MQTVLANPQAAGREGEMKRYHWTYQCHQCFIKSGYGFTGTESEAYDNAPSCCGDRTMYAIRGNEVEEKK